MGRWTDAGLLGRLRSGVPPRRAHLREWAATHAGVEAFVEPRTTVTETTMLLVARTASGRGGASRGPTRRRKLARSLKIAVYDVQLVGYPQRMRDHDARERILRRAPQP